jgi:hypothetical protein
MLDRIILHRFGFITTSTSLANFIGSVTRCDSRSTGMRILQENEKGLAFASPLSDMARPKRFELLTPWFVAKYSIQLSYGRLREPNYTVKRLTLVLQIVAESEGFEPSIQV